MKIFGFAFVFLFTTLGLSASPETAIATVSATMNKSEAELKRNGAVQLGEDLDLRSFGQGISRNFVWVSDGVGYVASTSRGRVVSMEADLPVAGLDKEHFLVGGQYRDSEEFQRDIVSLQAISEGYGGGNVHSTVSLGIRTTNLRFRVERVYVVEISIFENLEPGAEGPGSIIINLKKDGK